MPPPAEFWASGASLADTPLKTQHWATLAEQIAGVGYWHLDVNTKTIRWSPEMFRLYGLPVGDEPDLDSAMAAVHPDDFAAANDPLRQAIQNGTSYSSQVRLKRADGSWRTVAGRATCFRDSSGQVSAVLGTCIDITDAKLADEALRESESRYRLLADLSKDVIVRADKNGTILFISPGCRAMGYEPEELIGRNAAGLVHSEDLQAFVANTAQLFSSGPIDDSRLREHRFAHKNGDWVWLQGNPTVVRDAQGNPIEIVNVFRDVTERRKFDAELSSAKMVAEDAAAVKAEFLANMSHELRTPLTSIIGFAQLLKEQPELSPQSTKFASRVVEASHALLAIVNDVLDFSKLEAGQVEIKPEPTAPGTIATEVVQLLAPQADAKSIVLNLQLSDQLPETVALDRDRVRQILHNLVGNAVKFTDAGSVTLSVRFAKGTLHYEVCDTGPGVPQEQVDRLFKRFSQIDGSSSRSHGGTGLGLAICKGLADAMGGSIGVTSRFGEGATFLLEIPVAVTDMLALPVPTESGKPDLAGMRILVADDNAANRILVRALLEAVGVTLVVAGHGQEAIDLAIRASFDVILMDLHMPGVNGYAAARTIRASTGPNACTPILAFTADAVRLDDAEYNAAGFSGVVLKPISPTALLSAINDAVTATKLSQAKGRRLHG